MRLRWLCLPAAPSGGGRGGVRWLRMRKCEVGHVKALVQEEKEVRRRRWWRGLRLAHA